MKNLLILLTAFLLTSCAQLRYTDSPQAGGLYSKTVVINYPGPLRPISEVAVVTHDAILQIQTVLLNGHPIKPSAVFKDKGFLYSTGRYQMHLTPGDYQIIFCFYISNTRETSWCTNPVTKTMSLSAGKVIHFSWTGNGRTWSVIENDGSSDLKEIEMDFQSLTHKN